MNQLNINEFTVCKTLIATSAFFNSKSAHDNATETCDTAMEREFCQLLEFVRFLKLQHQIMSTDRFKGDSGGFGK